MQQTINNSQLEPLLAKLAESNLEFASRFQGLSTRRQPVHTLYGGANLYKPGAAQKIAMLAQRHFASYAQDYTQMARALGFAGEESLETEAEVPGSPAWIAKAVYDRVKLKLHSEAIENHRVDFEDGYGVRSDEEEDGHALSASDAMADGFSKSELPPFVGIRIKALTEEAKQRSLRTLDIFVTNLVAKQGKLPDQFMVTLPKVISEVQVDVLCEFLDLLEDRVGIEPGHIKVELMLENVQSLFNVDGKAGLPGFVRAGRGRVSCMILGTFDYTATCNVASTFQSHVHPAADFARQMMLASLMGTEVALSDGITNIIPIPPNKGTDLSDEQSLENQQVVYAAWKLHFDNILHSMKLGFYQGWDLNPAQIPVRFAAVYYFFLMGLKDSTERLRTFIDKAAQASLVGNTFDDAATGQGLVNFFVNGIGCGALTEDEALATGLTLEELLDRSFQKIVENRTGSPS
ncbi:MAG TPA: phosphoenolpyruvate kinase [Gammaproteobacteria bacterium]|nr:phosphoenolpyruvate kinase [Gammaproteobacteria bacterium]